jgi:hypothetical protein
MYNDPGVGAFCSCAGVWQMDTEVQLNTVTGLSPPDNGIPMLFAAPAGAHVESVRGRCIAMPTCIGYVRWPAVTNISVYRYALLVQAPVRSSLDIRVWSSRIPNGKQMQQQPVVNASRADLWVMGASTQFRNLNACPHGLDEMGCESLTDPDPVVSAQASIEWTEWRARCGPGRDDTTSSCTKSCTPRGWCTVTLSKCNCAANWTATHNVTCGYTPIPLLPLVNSDGVIVSEPYTEGTCSYMPVKAWPFNPPNIGTYLSFVRSYNCMYSVCGLFADRLTSGVVDCISGGRCRVVCKCLPHARAGPHGPCSVMNAVCPSDQSGINNGTISRCGPFIGPDVDDANGITACREQCMHTDATQTYLNDASLFQAVLGVVQVPSQFSALIPTDPMYPVTRNDDMINIMGLKCTRSSPCPKCIPHAVEWDGVKCGAVQSIRESSSPIEARRWCGNYSTDHAFGVVQTDAKGNELFLPGFIDTLRIDTDDVYAIYDMAEERTPVPIRALTSNYGDPLPFCTCVPGSSRLRGILCGAPPCTPEESRTACSSIDSRVEYCKKDAGGRPICACSKITDMNLVTRIDGTAPTIVKSTSGNSSDGECDVDLLYQARCDYEDLRINMNVPAKREWMKTCGPGVDLWRTCRVPALWNRTDRTVVYYPPDVKSPPAGRCECIGVWSGTYRIDRPCQYGVPELCYREDDEDERFVLNKFGGYHVCSRTCSPQDGTACLLNTKVAECVPSLVSPLPLTVVYNNKTVVTANAAFRKCVMIHSHCSAAESLANCGMGSGCVKECVRNTTEPEQCRVKSCHCLDDILTTSWVLHDTWPVVPPFSSCPLETIVPDVSDAELEQDCGHFAVAKVKVCRNGATPLCRIECRCPYAHPFPSSFLGNTSLPCSVDDGVSVAIVRSGVQYCTNGTSTIVHPECALSALALTPELYDNRTNRGDWTEKDATVMQRCGRYAWAMRYQSATVRRSISVSPEISTSEYMASMIWWYRSVSTERLFPVPFESEFGSFVQCVCPSVGVWYPDVFSNPCGSPVPVRLCTDEEFGEQCFADPSVCVMECENGGSDWARPPVNRGNTNWTWTNVTVNGHAGYWQGGQCTLRRNAWKIEWGGTRNLTCFWNEWHRNSTQDSLPSIDDNVYPFIFHNCNKTRDCGVAPDLEDYIDCWTHDGRYSNRRGVYDVTVECACPTMSAGADGACSLPYVIPEPGDDSCWWWTTDKLGYNSPCGFASLTRSCQSVVSARYHHLNTLPILIPGTTVSCECHDGVFPDPTGRFPCAVKLMAHCVSNTTGPQIRMKDVCTIGGIGVGCLQFCPPYNIGADPGGMCSSPQCECATGAGSVARVATDGPSNQLCAMDNSVTTRSCEKRVERAMCGPFGQDCSLALNDASSNGLTRILPMTCQCSDNATWSEQWLEDPRLDLACGYVFRECTLLESALRCGPLSTRCHIKDDGVNIYYLSCECSYFSSVPSNADGKMCQWTPRYLSQSAELKLCGAFTPTYYAKRPFFIMYDRVNTWEQSPGNRVTVPLVRQDGATCPDNWLEPTACTAQQGNEKCPEYGVSLNQCWSECSGFTPSFYPEFARTCTVRAICRRVRAATKLEMDKWCGPHAVMALMIVDPIGVGMHGLPEFKNGSCVRVNSTITAIDTIRLEDRWQLATQVDMAREGFDWLLLYNATVGMSNITWSGMANDTRKTNWTIDIGTDPVVLPNNTGAGLHGLPWWAPNLTEYRMAQPLFDYIHIPQAVAHRWISHTNAANYSIGNYSLMYPNATVLPVYRLLRWNVERYYWLHGVQAEKLQCVDDMIRAYLGPLGTTCSVVCALSTDDAMAKWAPHYTSFYWMSYFGGSSLRACVMSEFACGGEGTGYTNHSSFDPTMLTYSAASLYPMATNYTPGVGRTEDDYVVRNYVPLCGTLQTNWVLNATRTDAQSVCGYGAAYAQKRCAAQIVTPGEFEWNCVVELDSCRCLKGWSAGLPDAMWPSFKSFNGSDAQSSLLPCASPMGIGLATGRMPYKWPCVPAWTPGDPYYFGGSQSCTRELARVSLEAAGGSWTDWLNKVLDPMGNTRVYPLDTHTTHWCQAIGINMDWFSSASQLEYTETYAYVVIDATCNENSTELTHSEVSNYITCPDWLREAMCGQFAKHVCLVEPPHLAFGRLAYREFTTRCLIASAVCMDSSGVSLDVSSDWVQPFVVGRIPYCPIPYHEKSCDPENSEDDAMIMSMCGRLTIGCRYGEITTRTDELVKILTTPTACICMGNNSFSLAIGETMIRGQCGYDVVHPDLTDMYEICGTYVRRMFRVCTASNACVDRCECLRGSIPQEGERPCERTAVVDTDITRAVPQCGPFAYGVWDLCKGTGASINCIPANRCKCCQYCGLSHHCRAMDYGIDANWRTMQTTKNPAVLALCGHDTLSAVYVPRDDVDTGVVLYCNCGEYYATMPVNAVIGYNATYFGSCYDHTPAIGSSRSIPDTRNDRRPCTHEEAIGCGEFAMQPVDDPTGANCYVYYQKRQCRCQRLQAARAGSSPIPDAFTELRPYWLPLEVTDEFLEYFKYFAGYRHAPVDRNPELPCPDPGRRLAFSSDCPRDGAGNICAGHGKCPKPKDAVPDPDTCSPRDRWCEHPPPPPPPPKVEDDEDITLVGTVNSYYNDVCPLSSRYNEMLLKGMTALTVSDPSAAAIDVVLGHMPTAPCSSPTPSFDGPDMDAAVELEAYATTILKSLRRAINSAKIAVSISLIRYYSGDYGTIDDATSDPSTAASIIGLFSAYHAFTVWMQSACVSVDNRVKASTTEKEKAGIRFRNTISCSVQQQAQRDFAFISNQMRAVMPPKSEYLGVFEHFRAKCLMYVTKDVTELMASVFPPFNFKESSAYMDNPVGFFSQLERYSVETTFNLFWDELNSIPYFDQIPGVSSFRNVKVSTRCELEDRQQMPPFVLSLFQDTWGGANPWTDMSCTTSGTEACLKHGCHTCFDHCPEECSVCADVCAVKRSPMVIDQERSVYYYYDFAKFAVKVGVMSAGKQWTKLASRYRPPSMEFLVKVLLYKLEWYENYFTSARTLIAKGYDLSYEEKTRVAPNGIPMYRVGPCEWIDPLALILGPDTVGAAWVANGHREKWAADQTHRSPFRLSPKCAAIRLASDKDDSVCKCDDWWIGRACNIPNCPDPETDRSNSTLYCPPHARYEHGQFDPETGQVVCDHGWRHLVSPSSPEYRRSKHACKFAMCPPKYPRYDPITGAPNMTAVCGGHGKCIDVQQCSCSPGYYSPGCECVTGWTGENCKTSMCPVSAGGRQCGGHGTCVVNPQTLEAVCRCNDPNRYSGAACDRLKCPCVEDQGECVLNPAGNVYCKCKAGWQGYDCSVSVCPSSDTALIKVCDGMGLCLPDKRKCQCADPFCGITPTNPNGLCGVTCPRTPRTCVDPNDGEARMCNGRGRCVMSDDGDHFDCVCSTIYSGKWCQFVPDSCVAPELRPARYLSEGCNCLPGGNGYQCTCHNTPTRILAGYYCEIDATVACGTPPLSRFDLNLAECSGPTRGQCANVEVDANLPPNWQCLCRQGYGGPRCEVETCAMPCDPGVCIRQAATRQYTCNCEGTVYALSSTGRCSINCCPSGTYPSNDRKNCLCLNPRMDPRQGCMGRLCPVDFRTGSTCGPFHTFWLPIDELKLTTASKSFCSMKDVLLLPQTPGDPGIPSSSPVIMRSAGHDCQNGVCVCHWAYQWSNRTEQCEPICHLLNTATVVKTGDVDTMCSCRSGFSQAAQCRASLCLRGSWSGSAATGKCSCPLGWKDRYCQTPDCPENAIAPNLGGRCDCIWPYTRDPTATAAKICALKHACGVNGKPVGVPVPTIRLMSDVTTLSGTCICLYSTVTGPDCSIDKCGPQGVVNGNVCKCGSAWGGLYCNQPLCKNGGTAVNRTCVCPTPYTGPMCETRDCGTYGVYIKSQCNCLGHFSRHPITGYCNVSGCGAWGAPDVVDPLVCKCKMNATLSSTGTCVGPPIESFNHSAAPPRMSILAWAGTNITVPTYTISGTSQGTGGLSIASSSSIGPSSSSNRNNTNRTATGLPSSLPFNTSTGTTYTGGTSNGATSNGGTSNGATSNGGTSKGRSSIGTGTGTGKGTGVANTVTASSTSSYTVGVVPLLIITAAVVGASLVFSPLLVYCMAARRGGAQMQYQRIPQ